MQPSSSDSIVSEGRTKILQCQAIGESYSRETSEAGRDCPWYSGSDRSWYSGSELSWYSGPDLSWYSGPDLSWYSGPDLLIFWILPFLIFWILPLLIFWIWRLLIFWIRPFLIFWIWPLLMVSIVPLLIFWTRPHLIFWMWLLLIFCIRPLLIFYIRPLLIFLKISEPLWASVGFGCVCVMKPPSRGLRWILPLGRLLSVWLTFMYLVLSVCRAVVICEQVYYQLTAPIFDLHCNMFRLQYENGYWL